VALVRTDVSEERVIKVGELGTTLAVTSVVPSSPILTRATRRDIPEDAIFHSHRRENLKSYIVFFCCLCSRSSVNVLLSRILSTSGRHKYRHRFYEEFMQRTIDSSIWDISVGKAPSCGLERPGSIPVLATFRSSPQRPDLLRSHTTTGGLPAEGKEAAN
jgi:hypothetical protein